MRMPSIAAMLIAVGFLAVTASVVEAQNELISTFKRPTGWFNSHLRANISNPLIASLEMGGTINLSKDNPENNDELWLLNGPNVLIEPGIKGIKYKAGYTWGANTEVGCFYGNLDAVLMKMWSSSGSVDNNSEYIGAELNLAVFLFHLKLGTLKNRDKDQVKEKIKYIGIGFGF